jgi:drug/metabolite transporter (DMT)-like permease
MTGVALLLVAGILWSLNGALIKLIHEDGRGPHGVTIAFYRSLIAGLFLMPFAMRRVPPGTSNIQPSVWDRFRTLRSDRRRPGRFRIRPAAAWCVVFFALMTVCFVIANTMTQAANAIILQYTSTFWVFGLSPLVLRERPRTGDLGVLALAMAGVGIIFVGNAGSDPTGLVIALGAGLFFGLLTLMIRRLRDADSAAVAAINNLGSAILLLIPAILIGGLALTPRAGFLILIMGVVQFGLPYYLYTLGLQRVPAYHAAVITLVEPVLVPVWTYLAVSETVPRTTVVGGGVILLALVLFLRRARRMASTAAARTDADERKRRRMGGERASK